MELPQYGRRSFAGPISRDGFSMSSDTLYVEIDSHQHERCDPMTLYGLLTYTPPTQPLLTKAGKVAKHQPPPHKDEPAHFYRAQLRHYGLQEMKTKDPAKKKLLAAFSAEKTLTVPRHIQELEATLQKEWRAANKKAADEYQAEKKRKAGEDLEREERKKVQFGAIKRLAASSDEESEVDEEAEEEADKAHLREKILDLSKDRACSIILALLDRVPGVERVLVELTEPRLGTRTKQTARKFYAVKESRPVEVAPERPKYRVKQTARRGGAPASYAMKRSRPAEEKIATNSGSNDFAWAGSYDVLSPYLSGEWDAAKGRLELELYTSSTSSHIWAFFDFGIVSGVIRSTGPIPNKAKEKFSFQWRGRESGEGEMTFDDDDKGVITLLAGGKLKCKMEGGCFGKFEWVGTPNTRKHTKDRAQQLSKVQSWKKEWRSLNWRSSEAERQSRWGKWVEEPAPERAAGSDTTAGRNGGDDDCDMEDYDDEEEEGYGWDGGFY